MTAGQLAADRGQRNTFFITSDLLNTTGRITSANIATLAGQGHEIGGHAKVHIDLTTYAAAADRVIQYDTPKTVLDGIIGAGKTRSWAYPLGGRSVTTDTELYLRYERVFGIGSSIPAVIPLSERDDRFLIGRHGWVQSTHETTLDLIRLAARSPVVVVIYTHDPGNTSGAFAGDPTVAQVTEAYDLCATLGVPSVGVAEALPPSNRVINGGFENGLAGWVRPLGDRNGIVNTVVDTPSAGHTGTQSLHVGFGAANTGAMHVEQAIPCLPKTDYTLRFRAHMDGLLAGSCQWSLRQLDYAGAIVLDTISTVTANEAWIQKNRPLTTSATTATLVIQFTANTGFVGDWYVDHVDLRPTHLGSFG